MEEGVGVGGGGGGGAVGGVEIKFLIIQLEQSFLPSPAGRAA